MSSRGKYMLWLLSLSNSISELQFEYWFLCFLSSSVLKYLEKQEKLAIFKHLPSMWCRRPEWNPRLLASAWLNLGRCGHLESESEDRNSHSLFLFLLSFYHSASQVSKISLKQKRKLRSVSISKQIRKYTHRSFSKFL